MSTTDSVSFAESNATTLHEAPQAQQRTSLTGKPLQYNYDNHTNMISHVTDAGAKHLPPGYTDSSLVQIPIKFSDIGGPLGDGNADDDESNPIQTKTTRRGSFFKKLLGQDGSGGKKSDGEGSLVVVKMSRGDYLKYWAKGEDGKYLDSVIEPKQGRRQWVVEQIEKSRDW